MKTKSTNNVIIVYRWKRNEINYTKRYLFLRSLHLSSHYTIIELYECKRRYTDFQMQFSNMIIENVCKGLMYKPIENKNRNNFNNRLSTSHYSCVVVVIINIHTYTV